MATTAVATAGFRLIMKAVMAVKYHRDKKKGGRKKEKNRERVVWCLLTTAYQLALYTDRAKNFLSV